MSLFYLYCVPTNYKDNEEKELITNILADLLQQEVPVYLDKLRTVIWKRQETNLYYATIHMNHWGVQDWIKTRIPQIETEIRVLLNNNNIRLLYNGLECFCSETTETRGAINCGGRIPAGRY